MVRVICVAGSQPAYGKTTTSVNLAVGMSLSGKRTLLVDWNPKADASRQMNVRPDHRHPWCDATLRGMGPTVSVRDQLQLLTGAWDDEGLSTVDGWDSESCCDRGKAWARVYSDFDVILIDCPSRLGSFAESALWAADEVLLPLRCEPSALDAVPSFVQLLRRVLNGPGKQLDFTGVLLTQVDPDETWTYRVVDEIRNFFGEIVLETMIPRDETVALAASRQRPLLEFEPRSRAAFAYRELSMEVLAG